MPAVSADSFTIANEVTAQTRGRSRTNVRRAEQSSGKARTSVRFTRTLMNKAELLFANKPAVEMAVRAHCATRTAEYWKEGRPIGMEQFFALLDSNEGRTSSTYFGNTSRPRSASVGSIKNC